MKGLRGAQVAIYARFSSDRQSEASIEDQVRRCRTFIESAGGQPDAARVFSDYAVSGASLDRPGFEQMLSAVEAGKVNAIVVEDASRLSRDWADSAALFKKLEFAEVALFGVADGMDTSQRSSKLTYGIKSLINDVYLDDLRDKTLRGLEGRAAKGLATGNVAFGFRTERRADDTGSDIVIDDEAAKIVRRIFRLFADGWSYARIATLLNKEGVPSPRARTRHKGSKGWGVSTVRAMLFNERYVGRWSFKTTQWVKRPGSNKRVPRKRPQAEVMVSDRPELRIIAPDLWEAVQAKRRHRSDVHARGERATASRAVYPLSGLLRCGCCGGPMTILGGQRTAKRYRCSYQSKRGTCDNALSVREDVAFACVIREVRARVLRPKAIDFLRHEIARQLGAQSRDHGRELSERQQRLDRVERKIAGLIDFIANGERSEYITQTLADLESQARDEKAAIAELEDRADRPVHLPSVDELLIAAQENFADLVRPDPHDPDALRARERLHALFKDRRLDLHPVGEGDNKVYEARSAFYPLFLLAPSDAENEIGGPGRDRRFLSVVAGAGFEPATFGL